MIFIKVCEEDIHHDVYHLAKHDKEKNNKFFVQVEVHFADGAGGVIIRTSDDNPNLETTFLVLGAKSNNQNERPVKRSRPNDQDNGSCSGSSSGGSPFAGSTNSPAFSPQSSDTHASPHGSDPHGSPAFYKAQKLVVEELEAKRGYFEQLNGHVMKTGNGDIAYHIELKDQHDVGELGEGEIIGLTTDNQGTVKAAKMTSENAQEMFLKGVVAKSPYLEAKVPEDENVLTATICMLGMVPVLTMGPVDAGDALYPSRDEGMSGVAIPEYYIADRNHESCVGFALETIADCCDDEVNSVMALVSVMGGAYQVI